MSRNLLARCWVAVAIVLVCLGGFSQVSRCSPLLAAESTNENQTANIPAFRRLFVPADSPETWPVGATRFLPIPHAEFSRLVTGNQTPPMGQQPPPIRFSKAIYRAKLLSANTLSVTAELDVEVRGDLPRLLTMSSVDMALESAAWQRDPTLPVSIGLWGQGEQAKELAVLASQSDALLLRGKIAARGETATHTDFYFKKPIVTPQTFELALPANHSVTVSNAELLKTETGTLGDSLWLFQLAPHETHRIRIQKPSLSKQTVTLPLVNQTTSYQVEPAGLDFVTRLRIDASESPIAELKAPLASGLRVAGVTVDQQSADWQVVEGATQRTLVISCPPSKKPLLVEVRCLANFRAGTTWELPKLQFQSVSWTEGTISLLISPELELSRLIPHEATLQHIAGIADEAHDGEVFRFQEWSSASSIEIELARPEARLSTQSLTILELGRDETQANVTAILTASGGDLYHVEAAVASGWTLESVTATPKAALNEWHLDRTNGSTKVQLQLKQPLSRRNPLRLTMKLRESTGQSVLPAPAAELKIIRFIDAESRNEFLQLRPRNSNLLELAEHLQRAQRKPDELSAEFPLVFSKLLAASPENVLLDASLLNDSDSVHFLQQPAQYKADMQIVVDVLPGSIRHFYEIDCQLSSGAVSELKVEFVQPLPATTRWKIAGRTGLVEMKRLDTAADTLAQSTKSRRPARYLLSFAEALTGEFRLQASYTQQAQPVEHANLARLSQSLDWQGRIILRGALDGLRIGDQGWTPTSDATRESTLDDLPILGVYRIGPSDYRRVGKLADLQLERSVSDAPNSHLVAWLGEYQTLQAADGSALHAANYSLENFGKGRAKVVLPVGAELQEAWLDDQLLEPKQIFSEERAYEFDFTGNHRWHHLGVKYSTRESPLGGSAAIRPVVPECSFPVNLSRWTLWAPEQYEIDQTQQTYASRTNHWWKRIFGPLARSRDETLFNPFSVTSWTELWSSPLTVQQTRQAADSLATQLTNRIESASQLPLGKLLADLAEANQLTQLLFVDREALLAKGIQASTSCNDLTELNYSASALNARARPLSSYKLALLVSPDAIVLTTAERESHWHNQLRPTKLSGVFGVASDDLASILDGLRTTPSSEFVAVADWLASPPNEASRWRPSGSTTLADVGRQAQTVEFVDELPTLIVRQAHVQRALWYAVLLLTIVLGAWRLAHYPNATIFAGALAGAACLVAPIQWLTIPQAIFLGLIAAATLRIVRRATQFGDERFSELRKLASTSIGILLASLVLLSQPAAAQTEPSNTPTTADQPELPRVLVPIDSAGQQQGEDVYLPADFLERLRQSTQLKNQSSEQLVILAANYQGSLVNGSPKAKSTANQTEPWSLLWEIETNRPNRRLHLPLQRDEATWDATAHRLDGIPVQLDWLPDGSGCSVVLPGAGRHWLKVVCQPRITVDDGVRTLRLHVPPLPGAALSLSLASGQEGLRIAGASEIVAAKNASTRDFLLAANTTLELSWASEAADDSEASWERLEQAAWLQVDPVTSRLDVQLSLNGFRSTAQLLELDVSPQLELVAPEGNSPITEVLESSPSQSNRLRLKLRPGLPPNFVLPLQFELQRAVSVGRIYFPQVRVVGVQPAQSLFGVSVSAGLSYDEKATNELRRIEPAEFAAAWTTPIDPPLYAYSLGSPDPPWSLSVRPDPQSLSAQQNLRVHCLPNQVQVDFEAVVSVQSGSWLSHRIRVPETLRIDSIALRERDNTAPLAVRWSRVSPTEAIVFVGRPLQQSHFVELHGQLPTSSGEEIEMPRVQLLAVERSEIHMDLYRAEAIQVSWTSPQLVPKEVSGQRIARSGEELLVGHFVWHPSQTDEFSTLQIKRNEQQYRVDSLTTLEPKSDGWNAHLSSRITVNEGVLNRLTLEVPDSFRPPYVLEPKQVGIVDDELIETPNGKGISVPLSKPIVAGNDLDIQLSGKINLPADQRLLVPSLRWVGANQQERYVMLPTQVEGQMIAWRTNGLRRQQLPKLLQAFSTDRNSVTPFRVEQDYFEANEQSFRGTMQKAMIRHAKVTGVLGGDGQMIATAEVVLQPGRASSCVIQLPAKSQLRHLIVGDQPARHDARGTGRWRVPVGPPFMPVRIVVSYHTQVEKTPIGRRLTPPKILLGDQALPMPKVWWNIKTANSLQLSTPRSGQHRDEVAFANSGYQDLLQVTRDALSLALELPREEGFTWAQTWLATLRRAQQEWQACNVTRREAVGLAAAEETMLTLEQAFAIDNGPQVLGAYSLNYPPRWPRNLEVSPLRKGYYFVNESSEQLVVVLSPISRRNLWQAFAAIALVSGVLAVVLRLRRHPECYHDLCHWPHSLALAGGLAWWLLLKPSAIGMLVIAITLLSLALTKWRSRRQQKQSELPTRITLPAG